MRAGFFTLTVVALAACSQLPTQNRVVGGDIIKSASNDYAVFAQNGSAVAIRMGSKSITDDMAPAVNAIKRATGCDVVAGSIKFDPKSVSADISCRVFAPPDLMQKSQL
ncbi:MAG: hypothetical protein KC451_13860 [Amylibacter sp.]|nr:hypothetical protein [Amylibacter sp.]